MPFFDRLLRAGETKLVKRLARIAQHIETLEPEVRELSDDALRAKTAEFVLRHRGRWSAEVEKRLLAGEALVVDELPDDGSYDPAESLDELLPEAFAVVREAAQRTIGQRPFPVQLMGGAALHLGNIAEMKTGEGKTLTSVLPVYLNALAGKGVHVVTTNDYLAKRDSENMGRIHRFLGLSVGVILAEMPPQVRRLQYFSDVTYGTNNEFGFDYLRDNMAWNSADMVQRGHHYAIVDEADSILIDEARTPLIISGPAEQSARWYQEFARHGAAAQEGHPLRGGRAQAHGRRHRRRCRRSSKTSWASTTSTRRPTPRSSATSTTRSRSRSSTTATRTTSSATGRSSSSTSSPGACWSAAATTRACTRPSRPRRGWRSRPRTRPWPPSPCRTTSASTTSSPGMTGTAQTEAAELHQIYKLGVVPIPTNMPMVRNDQPDLIYKTEQAKFEAVADDIAEKHPRASRCWSAPRAWRSRSTSPSC